MHKYRKYREIGKNNEFMQWCDMQGCNVQWCNVKGVCFTQTSGWGQEHC